VEGSKGEQNIPGACRWRNLVSAVRYADCGALWATYILAQALIVLAVPLVGIEVNEKD
jgi:hypothetical protein